MTDGWNRFEIGMGMHHDDLLGDAEKNDYIQDSDDDEDDDDSQMETQSFKEGSPEFDNFFANHQPKNIPSAPLEKEDPKNDHLGDEQPAEEPSESGQPAEEPSEHDDQPPPPQARDDSSVVFDFGSKAFYPQVDNKKSVKEWIQH